MTAIRNRRIPPKKVLRKTPEHFCSGCLKRWLAKQNFLLLVKPLGKR